MNLRTYRAESMAAALAKVKRDLGRDALILHTRTVQEGRWFGLRRKKFVEIIASDGRGILPAPRARGSLPEGKQDHGAGMHDVSPSPAVADAVHDTAHLLEEVGELKALVGQLLVESRQGRLRGARGALFSIYQQLVENQVAADVATSLVHRVREELGPGQLDDPEVIRGRLKEYIASMVPATGPIDLEGRPRPYIVCLIGPTGVGKTTTIAKLAAQHALRERRRVGLITIDTYRIAAVDQLRTYADILQLPLQVVLAPADIETAMRHLEDRELIFIDTAGRSQNDEIRINELRRFLDVARPHELHLVLSSTCHHQNLVEAARRFGRLGVDRIIFTKLDEAVGFGVMLNVIRQVQHQISYLTTGQDVPDNIEIGEPEKIAELIVRPPQSASAPSRRRRQA